MSSRNNILEQLRFLDGSALKILAVVTMVIDHTASALLQNDYTALITVGGRTLDRYDAMRLIGRISYPLFAFLLVEGFLHTRSVRRYAANLLLFALLSEIPWNLLHAGSVFCRSQNVMFTLLLGLLGIWAVRDYHGDARKKSALLLGLTALAALLRSDYGLSGFGFILMLYLLRDQQLYRAILGCCMLPSHLAAGLAFIPIAQYNGRRGFIRSKPVKYAFYAVYPVHLLVLYYIKRNTIGV